MIEEKSAERRFATYDSVWRNGKAACCYRNVILENQTATEKALFMVQLGQEIFDDSRSGGSREKFQAQRL